MTKYVNPIITEDDKKLYESINRQFLSHFPDAPLGNPRIALSTCDTHLELKQPLYFTDPKGNPVSEIGWSEPYDAKEFWKDRIRIVWLGVALVSIIFWFFLYYHWGKW